METEENIVIGSGWALLISLPCWAALIGIVKGISLLL